MKSSPSVSMLPSLHRFPPISTSHRFPTRFCPGSCRYCKPSNYL
jgi:hypothetical protein